jgi:hypothetical protein
VEFNDSYIPTTKAQAAAAMSTVAEKLKDKLGPPHLGNLLSTLMSGLQGRIWTGKVRFRSTTKIAVSEKKPCTFSYRVLC